MSKAEHAEIQEEAIICVVLLIAYAIFADTVFFNGDYYTGLYALSSSNEPRSWLDLPFRIYMALFPLMPFLVIVNHFAVSYQRIRFTYRIADENGWK